MILTIIRNWRSAGRSYQTHEPNESTMIKNKLCKKFEFAKDLKQRIELALDEPSTNMVKFKILSEDFCILIKLYMEWSAIVSRSEKNLAFTQEIEFSVKERLANRLNEEKHLSFVLNLVKIKR